MLKQEKIIDYLVLVDIAYTEVYQRVCPAEFAELIAEINQNFLAAGFSPEGALLYQTRTVGYPERLRDVHNALFRVREYLSSLSWMLEFNILLLVGAVEDYKVAGVVDDLVMKLPGTNQIWREVSDRLLFEQLKTREDEKFYQVEGWLLRTEQSFFEQLLLKPEHRQLSQKLSVLLTSNRPCMLVGPTFAGKSLFVSILLRGLERPVIFLRACENTREPQVVFQPLLDYCREKCFPVSARLAALLQQSKNPESLTFQQFHCDLPQVLPVLVSTSALVVCDQLECWPEAAKEVLSSLLQSSKDLPLLLVSNEAAPEFLGKKVTSFSYPPVHWQNGAAGRAIPPDATPRMLQLIDTCRQEWQAGEDFSAYCSRLLTAPERRLLVLLQQVNGLLRRGDLQQLEPEAHADLEGLVSRKLVYEDDCLFVNSSIKFALPPEEIAIFRAKLSVYWRKKELNLEYITLLSSWGELSLDQLQRAAQALAYRGCASPLQLLRDQQFSQNQPWPVMCEYWLQRSTYALGDDWLPEGDEESDFVKAYHLCRQGKVEQANRHNLALLYRYSTAQIQPVFYAESMLLHGLLLLMQGNYRDAQYYFSQLERRAQLPAGLWYASQVYHALAFFFAQNLDQCLIFIKEQQRRPEEGQWQWRFYLDFLELRLLFRVGAYREASELVAELEQRALHYQQPSLAGVCFRWRQRCIIYQGDYASGWSQLKALPPGSERDLFMVEACVFARRYQEALPLLAAHETAPPAAARFDRFDWQDGFQAFEDLIGCGERAPSALEQEMKLLAALVRVQLLRAEEAEGTLARPEIRNSRWNREIYHYVTFLCEQAFQPGSSKYSLHLSHAVSLVRSLINTTHTPELRRSLRERHYWNRCILQSYELRNVVSPRGMDIPPF